MPDSSDAMALKAASHADEPMKEKRRRRWTEALCLTYAAGAAVATVLVLGFTDRWWPATVLSFMPRWPLAALAAPLLALALWQRRFPWAGLVGAAGLLALGPYMGHSVMFGSAPAPGVGAAKLRVVTFNVQARRLSEPWLGDIIADAKPDVLAMQECRPGDRTSAFPGYHFAADRGLCLLSRFPILLMDAHDRKEAYRRGGAGSVTRFELDMNGRTIHLVIVHLETVREGFVALRYKRFDGVDEMRRVTELRRWESTVARDWAGRVEGPVLVLGDFNLTVESDIYRTSWGDMTNAFSACGSGYGYSKHSRFIGVRIDHILMNDAWTCSHAELNPHGQSDHTALVADLHLLGTD
jgi:vancomycin resistance protein VanJ